MASLSLFPFVYLLGEKPFECKSCGRMFRQSGNLTKHMKSHENTLLRWNRKTNMKPFKCSFFGCEKSFTAKSSLQNHLKTHPPSDHDGSNTNPVVYKCNHKDCALTFSSEAELYMHLSIEPTRTELEREIVFLKNTLSTIFDVLGNPDQQLSNGEIIHEVSLLLMFSLLFIIKDLMYLHLSLSFFTNLSMFVD